MNFPLDEELIGQIMFAMEDQQGAYAVDPQTGELHSDVTEATESDPLVPVPAWGPSDGFQLMERFVAGLRNPLLREQLTEALASGRGVFRRFKDILKTRPQIEHLWFVFKERQMRRVVREWYNDERELAGLQRLPEEPEDSAAEAAELAAGDFALRRGGPQDLEAVQALDRLVFAEVQPGAAYLERRRSMGGPLDSGSLLCVAETPGGELAGFYWALQEEDPITGERNLQLVQLAVAPPYRGLGLGRLLLDGLASDARDLGYHRLLCALAGGSLRLEAGLRRMGFVPRSVLLELDPGSWAG